jgi:hypothetical protein
MGGAILSVTLAPLWTPLFILFNYLFINSIQNPNTAVRPMDIGMVKE